MKNGEFIGKAAKKISQEELKTIVDMVKADLEKFSVRVTNVN